MRLLLIFLVTMHFGCGSLQRPDYRPAGYKHIIKNHVSGARRPASVLSATHLNLIWPVNNPQISQSFAPPYNRKHDGIDLRGRRGTPIKAAHSGYVVYAGAKYKGYGKMVILNSGGELSTLYAHLNQKYVKNGQHIKRGQVIGTMGRTGRATGVHLHFEVLKNKIPMDPMKVLP